MNWRILLALLVLALAQLACGGEIDQQRDDPQGYCDAWCGVKAADPDCRRACLATTVR